MKNKAIAIIGIVFYMLGVILSAEDLQGSPRFPPMLILISGTGMLMFIIMATIHLWKDKRYLSVILTLSTILFGVLTVICDYVKLNVIILTNITSVVWIIAYFWTIVTLFRKRDYETLKEK
jgi:hypothetical protein